MSQPTGFHLHLVSDSTGETIISVARACLAQFEGVEVTEHFWNLVRSDRQLDMVLEEIETYGGVVIYTVVSDHLRLRLHQRCVELGIRAVSVLEPVMFALAEHLARPAQSTPGRQHLMDAAYFDRVEAMEFSLSHDDGQGHEDLFEADAVLVGVSRTSKTPTCLYLANRGVKAANVPFVPGVPLPPTLDQLTRPLIVGLTKDPEQLVQIRRNRLSQLHQGAETDYVDIDRVRSEVQMARRHFASRGWPIIDVSRRAIEETSAEILRLLARRRGKV